MRAIKITVYWGFIINKNCLGSKTYYFLEDMLLSCFWEEENLKFMHSKNCWEDNNGTFWPEKLRLSIFTELVSFYMK